MKLSIRNTLLVFGTLATIFSGTLAFAYANTVGLTGSLTVSTSCLFTTNTMSLNFGTVAPGANVSTAHGVNVINNGNAASNVLTSATTWAYDSNTFGAGNTLWDSSSQVSYLGTPETVSNVDTNIVTSAPNALTMQTSNVIYFGVAVPGGEPPGAWTQTINIISNC